MNILIIGEYSGFAKHLKNGFSQLGHRVTVVQSGDGWKKLYSDEDILCRDEIWKIGKYPLRGSNRIRAIITNYRVHKSLKKRSSKFNLIIVVNYKFLSKEVTSAGVKLSYLRSQLRKGAKIIMSECGLSCAETYFHPKRNKLLGIKIPIKDRRYTFLLRKSSSIIPTCFSYYEQIIAYSNYMAYDVSKVHCAIPLPITIDTSVNFTTCVNRKIVIFHGIIRPTQKGTRFIHEAMNRLQKEMPDKVECISKGGMPYDEYIKLFEKVDILVDQTYGNGWGMNAAIAALKGKCVLTPCGPENSENMQIPNIPLIQIGPDSEQIYKVLKELVLNPSRIDEIKKESRNFIEQYCDSKIVAGRYLTAVNLDKSDLRVT